MDEFKKNILFYLILSYHILSCKLRYMRLLFDRFYEISHVYFK